MKNKTVSLKKNIFWGLIPVAMNMLFMFILAPFLVKNLGAEQYGVYAFLGTMVGVFGIMNLGLSEATLYYFAKYQRIGDLQKSNSVFNATLWIYLIVGILFFICMFLASDIIIQTFHLDTIGTILANQLFLYTVGTFTLLLIGGGFAIIPQALMRFDIYSLIQIGQTAAQFFIYLGTITLGYGLSGLIISNFIIAIFYIIITFFIAFWLFPRLQITFPTRSAIKEVFAYGIYSLLTTIVGIAWRYSDTLLIAYLLGPLYVAFFSIPQQIVLKLMSFTGSFRNVLFSKFSNSIDKNDIKLIYLDMTYVLLNITIVIFVPLASIFSDFLTLWISKEFAKESEHIAFLLAISTVIRGAFIPYESLFNGIGKPKLLLVVATLSALTIALADLILIPLYGLSGAGYALCISPIWGILTLIYVIKYELKYENLIKPAILLITPLLIAILDVYIAYEIRLFFPEILTWFEFICLGFIVMVIVMVTLLLNALSLGKKHLILSIIKKGSQ
jgi:O-antigen/teichoic acid export membrane protein